VASLMGIINLNEPEERIRELTRHRSLAAVPFGGRYRLIDFTLSNMVNAGIRNVGILLSDKYGPLLDHLKNGKEWDLDRRRDGMFLLPPASHGSGNHHVTGDIPNLYHNMTYIQKSRQDYVLISGSNMICNMDYRDVLSYHLAKDADITIVYNETMGLAKHPPFTNVITDDSNRVTDLAINPRTREGEKASMNMYVMSKKLLMEIIDHCASRGKEDFLIDGIIPHLGELKVYGYAYRGYVGEINSLQNYFKHSMELLNPAVWQELFFKAGNIHTKIKHEAPVRYCQNSQVKNSIIANGCIIEGTVENSILFRGVHVAQGAVVRDSIVMQKAQIGPNVLLQNAILDKDVQVSEGKHLIGDGNYPIVIHKLARL
jgi:glucose-1-phosphate adenylyltransferase